MQKISGILMIIFMVLGLSITIPAIFKGLNETENFNLSTLSNGKWSSLFETKFSDILPPREPSLSLWGMLELGLFQEGRKGVLIGKDGWLFTNEEFIADKNRNELIVNNKKFILDTATSLKENNINLIVAFVPAKARVMHEKLGDYKYPIYNQSFYSEMIDFFNERNIVAPNLNTTLNQRNDVFFKTDTHWTPKASLLTAKKIASNANQNDLFTGLDNYVFTTPQSEKFDGDLTRYVPAGDLNKKYNINENQSLYRNVTLNANDNDKNEIETDLFGDNNIPVTLVGTSYSANPLWNFQNHLKYYLKSDVYNAADEGQGPFTTMKEYIQSDEYKNTPPQLIIWEIPERYMSLPEKK